MLGILAGFKAPKTRCCIPEKNREKPDTSVMINRVAGSHRDFGFGPGEQLRINIQERPLVVMYR